MVTITCMAENLSITTSDHDLSFYLIKASNTAATFFIKYMALLNKEVFAN